MNKAIIIGNLTKNPDLKTTQSGLSVCTFTLAVNRAFSKEKEVDYIPCVTWRGLADNCAKFLSKGKKACVSGRIQVRDYDDKNGNKRYVAEIIADDVEFLSPKGERQEVPAQDPTVEPDFEPLDDEQMPF